MKIRFAAVHVAARISYHVSCEALAAAHSDDFSAANDVQALDQLYGALSFLSEKEKGGGAASWTGMADLGGASDSRRTKRVVSGTDDGFHCMADSVHVTKDVNY